MMFYKKNNNWVLLLALALLAGFTACVKTEFDEPPSGPIQVDVTANTTIAELKKLHVTLGGYDKITGDVIIHGTVVMDDRSGNYYKTIVIQDETGGIEIKFNDGYLYSQFPVGREIFIKCKDLLLTDYNGLTQLTGSTVEQGGVLEGFGLTEAQVISNVVKGNYATGPIAGKTVEINKLTPDMISTLITLENVQFIRADTAKTWAEPVTKNSLNRKLEDCNGLQIIVRTSGYSTFAALKTPSGNGTLTGVLGVYNGDYQLYIRDETDAKMTADRCLIGGVLFSEDFGGVTNDVTFSGSGWKNIAVAGTKTWVGKTFSSQRYVQASAFNTGITSMETWLVTPGIDLKKQRILEFESSMAYWKHDGLKVFVSNNFDGVDPKKATWTEIDCDLAGSTSGNHNWVKSGAVTLPIYSSGVGYIAFQYVGSSNANTTDYRIDNVVIK